ncbi:MAG: MucBP domain-containing protein [Lachnospiraceae bacterium]|nr:MucBP domain-containing protein [Lachnospiraceae bacterium]
MEKMRTRFGVLLIAALLFICFPAVPAKAAPGDYTYTIRLYSGQQGTFANGQRVLTYEGLSYGSTVTFNPNDGNVVLNNGSKYYIKGIRESGRDNNTVSSPSFTVVGDRDYVVAYGLRGNMVAYTVNYVDITGSALAPSETYYGNVGDKPVVAFLYIDGYQPLAYNLTKTLVENEAENEFTFVYELLTGAQPGTTVIREEGPDRNRSMVEVIEGSSDRRMDSDQLYDLQDGNEDGDLNGISLTEPQDMIDLDNPDDMDMDGIFLEDPAVPLADMKFKLGPIEVDARTLLLLCVIIICAAVIAASSYWFWRPYRKKDKNEEKDAAQPV